MTKSDSYMLAVGRDGVDRLALLNQIYGPFTEAFLSGCGLRPGMTVMDVGCGTGTVTAWIASKVGSEGHALGVDVSNQQLEVGRQRAAGLGLRNVDFVSLSADALAAVGRQFDFVYSRFLLVHLERPEEALREMLDRVKPGGILAIDEQVLAGASCFPDSAAFRKSVDLVYSVARSRGLDFDYGMSTYRALRSLGCERVDLRIAQPALTSKDTKRLWPLFFIEARVSLLDSGLVSESEFEDMMAGLMTVVENDDYLILPMRNHQVAGRRPDLPGAER
jgi:SAM-dependent methyltransferase